MSRKRACSIAGLTLVLLMAPALRGSVVQVREPSSTLTLEGVVLDPDGVPVEGAIVWQDQGELEPHAFPLSATRVFSDESGHFTLEYHDVGDAPRDLFVHAFKEGFPLTNLATRTGTERVVVRLEAPRYIEGTIRNEAGEPLEGVAVLAQTVAYSHYAWPVSSISQRRPDIVHTARDGRFSFPAADGRWKIAFAKDGYVTEVIEELRPGSDSLAITLRRGVDVCGTVKHSDGAAVEDVSVILQDRLHQLDELTDENGRFCLRGVAPGTHSVRLNEEGLSLILMLQVEAEKGGEEVILSLPPYGTLKGTVTGPDGAAIGGVEIAIQSSAAEHSFFRNLHTDAAGEFSVEMPAGEFSLTASTTGLVPHWSEALSLGGGDVHVHDISLIRGSTLRGRVTDRSGAPVEAHIRAQKHGQEASRASFYELSTTTDDDGYYDIPIIAPGVREVIVSSVCCVEKKVVLEFENNVDQTLDVALDRGHEIAGRVTDHLGQPFANRDLHASLVGEKNQRPEYGATDARGRYRFTGLREGMWRIELDDDEYYAPPITVQAGEGSADLVAMPGGIIDGVISGLDGRAVVMAYRSIDGRDEVVGSDAVGEGGEYELRGLPDGPIHLMLEVLRRFGYIMGTVDVAPPQKYSFDHDLRLVPRVEGKVLINGEARSDLRMYWWEDGSRRKAETAKGGMLEAPLLTNGCKWVTVTGGDIGWLRKRINVLADEFHLEINGAPMTVEVVNSAGLPVDGATISFQSVNCEARQDRDYVTKEGVAQIPFVPYGPFRVQVKTGDQMTEMAGVHAAGDGGRLTLRLPTQQ